MALLDAAVGLLRYSDASTAGVWPRAAALLARQALEEALDNFWMRRAPGVQRVSIRAQLLCLRSYIDAPVAARAAHAWHALSRGCHHHAYELAPTSDELTNWIEDVDKVAQALAEPERE